ncbi:MAG: hypothetical protein N3A68_01915 [Bacteroidia bacterium]|jgi:shikimate dehydrogenase|nr:hypothetical protein [Bacteroidia bacterium]GIV23310.1 MAG: shikimate dehydrogenase (NADP(+)) [Bacteroidia bacterium]
MRLGLLAGEKVLSFSPWYFRRMYGLVYEKLTPSSPESLKEEVTRRGWIGFNVTTPYKEWIYPLLAQKAPEVEAIQAANTVCVFPGGIWRGHNTDYLTARYLLGEFMQVYAPWEAVYILGTGGAARAVAWAHAELLPDIPITFFSRTPTKQLPFPRPHTVLGYEEASHASFPKGALLVQATPIGMFPEMQAMPPFPLSAIQPGWVVWELIYHPNPTLFAQRAQERGASIETGYLFLRKQAEYSRAVWDEVWLQHYKKRRTS